uniref:Large ribosomal subunit protein mL64 n=1 Tax=Sinocyclocheilus anshuiensis TaxID=1608454 RepID=A0A671TAD0_9TELE
AARDSPRLQKNPTEWQKKYERRLFGRYGGASGVDPAKLWPSHVRLGELAAEDREWHPPIEVMLESIAAREREKEQRRMEREKIIAANMAKMPKMISDWKKQKREAKQKQREEKIKRDKLLAEARERFGYALDPQALGQVQRDGRRNRERGEEEEKTSETQEEGGRAGNSGSRIQPVTLREQGLLYSATVPYCKIGFFVSLSL